MENALSVLGVYFAMMAVLAIVVEAVISWLKLIPTHRLQGQPSPEEILNESERWLDKEDADTNKVKIDAINRALKSIGETELVPDGTTGFELAEKVGDATKKYIQSERMRRSIIRILTILFGIGFAVLLQINTLALLDSLLPDVINNMTDGLGYLAPIIGFVLSGLAASAGSSFWHDQMARLRSVKSIKDEATSVVNVMTSQE